MKTLSRILALAAAAAIAMPATVLAQEGVYVYRIEAGTFSQTKVMTLMK